MAGLTICDIDDEVKEILKKLRFNKEKKIKAVLFKVDPKTRIVIKEEEFEEITIEDLQEELPERQPRFLAISYVRNHDDGRVSYPLLFIYICPSGCKPELNMMYAGTRNVLQKELGITKDFELRDREDLTKEWLEEKLAFFR